MGGVKGCSFTWPLYILFVWVSCRNHSAGGLGKKGWNKGSKGSSGLQAAHSL